jgi:UDPglucose 6-dehydrogenase
MKVGVLGTGYVGLVTSASLAAIDHDVIGMDLDPDKIASLQRGRPTIFEPGLEKLIEQGLAKKKLAFTDKPAEAIAESDVVFICVGTPPSESGDAKLIAVERASRDVAQHAQGRTVVAEKSTVPTGTAARIRRVLLHERPERHIEVVSNPEFLREGTAVEDALNPERILVGAQSLSGFETMRKLYAPFVNKGSRLIETDIATAELAKHASNAFLALKISYANALARLCERAGADVADIADVMGADPRIGRAFLNAGIGYGGFCFPKDLQAFERLSSKLGYDFPLLREVERINDEALESVFIKVREALWNLEDKRVALLGLSFKPGTDDVRFSPPLALARRLLEAGAYVAGYDPKASDNARAEIPELEIAPGPYEAATGAHCVVLCTEWKEFGDIDLAQLKSVMSYPVVVDGRNFFDPDDMKTAGIHYYPAGRPPVV